MLTRTTNDLELHPLYRHITEYQLYVKSGRLESGLSYVFKATGSLMMEMNVYRALWRSTKGFQALLHFFWRHRSQCENIVWMIPEIVPLTNFMRDPRIKSEIKHSWMGGLQKNPQK